MLCWAAFFAGYSRQTVLSAVSSYFTLRYVFNARLRSRTWQLRWRTGRTKWDCLVTLFHLHLECWTRGVGVTSESQPPVRHPYTIDTWQADRRGWSGIWMPSWASGRENCWEELTKEKAGKRTNKKKEENGICVWTQEIMPQRIWSLALETPEQSSPLSGENKQGAAVNWNCEHTG